MATVINILYDGPATALNMIVGSRPHLSKTAKLWMYGLTDREQPLGSFFPMGFLTPPIVCRQLMLWFLYLIYFCYILFPSLLTFCFRGWKGVNLRLTTCSVTSAPLIVCLCLVVDYLTLDLSYFHLYHFPSSRFTLIIVFSPIHTCLISA